MKNIINKKIIGSIMLVMIISICQIIFFQIPSASAGTAQPVELTLEVPFSKANAVIKFNTGDTSQLAGYIKQIYNYAIGAVAILAAIMLMVGGLMWIVSGGNTNTVGEAKTIIGASLSGLVLVMTSYLILYQVNPSLVLLSRDISPIGAINSCNWTTPVALLNTGASQQGQAAPADATSVTVYGCSLSTEKKADSSCSAKKPDANSLCCCASKTAAAATTAAPVPHPINIPTPGRGSGKQEMGGAIFHSKTKLPCAPDRRVAGVSSRS